MRLPEYSTRTSTPRGVSPRASTLEYFKYMLDLLRANDGGHIKVFGGGGGVIVPAEIDELQDYGVARIYSPEDGQRMGLQGMINDMLARSDFDPARKEPKTLAQMITALELGRFSLKEKTGSARSSASPEPAARGKIVAHR